MVIATSVRLRRPSRSRQCPSHKYCQASTNARSYKLFPFAGCLEAAQVASPLFRQIQLKQLDTAHSCPPMAAELHSSVTALHFIFDGWGRPTAARDGADRRVLQHLGPLAGPLSRRPLGLPITVVTGNTGRSATVSPSSHICPKFWVRATVRLRLNFVALQVRPIRP